MTLIDDLEAAQEGSRQLDKRFYCAIEDLDESRFPGGPWPNLPHYTTNLKNIRDACDWVLLEASDIGADGLALVRLGNPATSQVATGIHPRLILAWCIAVLEAKAHG